MLYSFAGSPDGGGPEAGLIDVSGTLYGTTIGGGTSSDGTVFAVSKSGKERVLYSFGGDPDGAQPQANLLDVKGTLYGTTSSGGTNNAGTVFSISTTGEEHLLHNFSAATDGFSPEAGLIEVNGTLYGTAVQGGGAYSIREPSSASARTARSMCCTVSAQETTAQTPSRA